jgi:3-oxoacid CoA-transferase subunit A
MTSKVFASFDKAIYDIIDEATIVIGGFGGSVGMTQNLILTLRDKGVKKLTIISNTGGMCEISLGGFIAGSYVDHAILFQNKQVKKMVGSFLGSPSPTTLTSLEKQWQAGEVEVETMPQGTLSARLLAGGAGYGGIYIPTGVGTIIEQGKEKRVINGKEYILELPLKPDFAFVRAYKADTMGNLTYRLAARNMNPVAAKAAKVTIAEVDEIVELGGLEPDIIVTPGIYVHRIVKIPKEGKDEEGPR